MIAFCGINCSECPCYQGTMTANLETLQKIAREWSAPGTQHTVTDMICLGCTKENTDFMYSWCKGCKIRNCAIEKGVTNCVACDAYDECEKIQSFLQHSQKTKPLMDLLRGKYKARA